MLEHLHASVACRYSVVCVCICMYVYIYIKSATEMLGLFVLDSLFLIISVECNAVSDVLQKLLYPNNECIPIAK